MVSINPVQGHGDEDPWTLDRVMAEMAQSAKPTVRFVEERHLSITTEPVVLTGTMSYENGRLEKVTRSPKAERVLIDGDRVRIASPDQDVDRTAYLGDIPALESFVASLRATLDGDLGALRRRFRVDYTANGADWRLVLQPLSDEARAEIREVVISGRTARIESLTVMEASGDRTVVRIIED